MQDKSKHHNYCLQNNSFLPVRNVIVESILTMIWNKNNVWTGIRKCLNHQVYIFLHFIDEINVTVMNFNDGAFCILLILIDEFEFMMKQWFYKTFFHFCDMALIIRVLLINEYSDNKWRNEWRTFSTSLSCGYYTIAKTQRQVMRPIDWLKRKHPAWVPKTTRTSRLILWIILLCTR